MEQHDEGAAPGGGVSGTITAADGSKITGRYVAGQGATRYNSGREGVDNRPWWQRALDGVTHFFEAITSSSATFGAIVGAVVGFVLLGPAGAALGATIGRLWGAAFHMATGGESREALDDWANSTFGPTLGPWIIIGADYFTPGYDDVLDFLNPKLYRELERLLRFDKVDSRIMARKYRSERARYLEHLRKYADTTDKYLRAHYRRELRTFYGNMETIRKFMRDHGFKHIPPGAK